MTARTAKDSALKDGAPRDGAKRAKPPKAPKRPAKRMGLAGRVAMIAVAAAFFAALAQWVVTPVMAQGEIKFQRQTAVFAGANLLADVSRIHVEAGHWAEIKQLVMEREPCVVRDAKTGADITRSILLQIILEEEANGTPMFTAEVLANVIRFYGHAMQGLMGGYLEKNMQALMQMQAPLVQGTMGNPLFQQMQEQMQKQTEQLLGTFGLKR